MNNFKLNAIKIFTEFEKKYKDINIKNLNIKILDLIKIKTKNGVKNLTSICNIKEIEERKFFLIFDNNVFLSEIIKNKIFEKYGFQCIKKNLGLEIIIPKISFEFRKNFTNFVKIDSIYYINLLENKRKNKINDFKQKYSKQEQYIYEKELNNFVSNSKIKIKEITNKIIEKILNE